MPLKLNQHPAARRAWSPHSRVVRELALQVQPRCAICERIVTSTFVVHDYLFFRCTFCDYAFLDPAVACALSGDRLFGDDYFCGGGAGYTNYLDEGELLRAHGRRYGRLLARRGAHRILDVGAAAGFIMRGMIDAGCDPLGIEPNVSMAEYAVHEMGLDVCTTTLEHVCAADQFDAVCLLQVVDHVEDIRRSFERVSELTRVGGWCLIEFGDHASLTARLMGFGWHEYAPPSVQRVFSLHALRGAAR